MPSGQGREKRNSVVSNMTGEVEKQVDKKDDYSEDLFMMQCIFTNITTQELSICIWLLQREVLLQCWGKEKLVQIQGNLCVWSLLGLRLGSCPQADSIPLQPLGIQAMSFIGGPIPWHFSFSSMWPLHIQSHKQNPDIITPLISTLFVFSFSSTIWENFF